MRVCEWMRTHNEIASALVPPIKVSELTCCIFKQFNLFVISFCDGTNKKVNRENETETEAERQTDSDSGRVKVEAIKFNVAAVLAENPKCFNILREKRKLSNRWRRANAMKGKMCKFLNSYQKRTGNGSQTANWEAKNAVMLSHTRHLKFDERDKSQESKPHKINKWRTKNTFMGKIICRDRYSDGMGTVRKKMNGFYWQISKMSRSDAAQETERGRKGRRNRVREREKCGECVSCSKCMHEFIRLVLPLLLLLLFIAYLPLSPNICLQNHAKA